MRIIGIGLGAIILHQLMAITKAMYSRGRCMRCRGLILRKVRWVELIMRIRCISRG